MSEISSLSLKIPLELKEKLKEVALKNQVSISAEVSARLFKSFDIDEHAADCEVDVIDSQNTEERVEPLTSKEIKKLRQLLKFKSSSKKK
ncbi:Arc family DNA-binding protein [Musicola keenii]|uniref:Arc family DNA-binding protein n=1 Tax=Musicola keenii TaxID=2884250 RepID=UPI00177ED1B3|nr:Arc family DNA-binding protein [Musicola keenii]